VFRGWPVYEVSEEKQAFANIDVDEEPEEKGTGIDNLEDIKGARDDDSDDDVPKPAAKQTTKGFGGMDLDIDLSDDEPAAPTKVPTKAAPTQTGLFFSKENPIIASVKKNSNIAGEYASVGLFAESMEKLETQIGLQLPENLSSTLMDLYLGSDLYYSTMSFGPILTQTITPAGNPSCPLVCNSLKAAEKKLKTGYSFAQELNSAEAINTFRDLLNCIPLMSLTSQAELSSVQKLISISTEYIVAFSCNLEMESAPPERQIELSIVMALPNLHPEHRMLTVRAAMVKCFKTKNFIAASYLARKLLKLAEENPNSLDQGVLDQTSKLLNKAEASGKNENSSASFDEGLLHDPNVIQRINPASLVIMSKTEQTRQCPLDKSSFPTNMTGQICHVCGICKVGKETVGLKITR
jgi:Coatomer (COPI) alpha subunit C-terminus